MPKYRFLSHASSRSNRISAFTLIELLVSIAVVAILIGLILAGIGKVRTSALEAKGVSNLRQIGAALQLYLNENGGELMPRARDEADADGFRFWTAMLYGGGYLPDKAAFYDPTFPPYGPEESPRAEDFTTQIQQTFGMRDWTRPGTSNVQQSYREPKPVVLVDDPANFFIIADSIWLNWETQGYGISPNHSNQKVRLNGKGTATTLFLDGHVAEMPGAYFLELGETQGEYSEDQGYDVWRPGDE